MLRILLLALAMVGGSLYACLWLTNRAVYQDALPIWALYVLRALLLGVAVTALLVAFALFLRRSRCRASSRRVWLAVTTTGVTLLLLEGAFMFVPRSHNVGHTLAARVWRRLYWQENSLGYRDAEHVRAAGKKTVFVLGDSFAAGDGTALVADRFSNLLEVLDPTLHVLNLGRCGADSIAEYRALQRHPLQPDVLVLQYYPNDIEGTARRCGLQLPGFSPYSDLPRAPAWIISNSFLFDFAYWQLPHGDQLAYACFLERAQDDEGIISQHLAELAPFCDYAEHRHVPLVVVVFPVLMDPAKTAALTARVEAMFTARGAAILDVATLVENLPVAARTANGQDAHPSRVVHERVARGLVALLR
jgi:hypothetical protein